MTLDMTSQNQNKFVFNMYKQVAEFDLNLFERIQNYFQNQASMNRLCPKKLLWKRWKENEMDLHILQRIFIDKMLLSCRDNKRFGVLCFAEYSDYSQIMNENFIQYIKKKYKRHISEINISEQHNFRSRILFKNGSGLFLRPLSTMGSRGERYHSVIVCAKHMERISEKQKDEENKIYLEKTISHRIAPYMGRKNRKNRSFIEKTKGVNRAGNVYIVPPTALNTKPFFEWCRYT